MRQASAIDFTAPSEQDGADTRVEHLAELADALLEQVGAVRSHYERLEQTLAEEAPGTVPTVGGARPVEHEPATVDEVAPTPHVHDSARLVVMEMAMSGSTRQETKSYLRDSLGIDGGEPIVDEVFDRTEAAQEAAPLHKRLFTRRRD